MIDARRVESTPTMVPMMQSDRVLTPAQNVLRTGVVLSRKIALVTVVAGFGITVVPVPRIAVILTLTFAAAGLIAGLPHGSVDHLLAVRAAGTSPTVAVVVYAGVAVLTWAGLFAAGPIMFATVIALSLVHFGLGEVQVYRRGLRWRPHPAVALCVAVAGTGALLLPLARSGELVRTVASALSPDAAVILSSDLARLALVALWVLAAGVAVVAAGRAGRPGVVLDVVLVGALGAVAPPLIAFAVWFGGWHALRHTARLLVTEPGCAALVEAGRPGSALRRFIRLGAVPSLAAVAVLGVLVIVTLNAPTPELAIAEVLRLLLALTVPHMLIVFWLDRQPDGLPA